MEANKRRYTELVGGSVQFVIPVFQRDYNWAEEQCEQLWLDIENIGRKKKKDHFFGPVVYISTTGISAAFTRWLLIDGQQRMTTVCLLMTALRDHITREPSQVDTAVLDAVRMEHDFLINTFERPDQRRKLVLRKRDDATLRWLVEKGEQPEASGKSASIVRNYQFFREKLRKNEELETVLEGVGRLTVVDVRLERGTDDPQQIFESLNSTGLDLTQADLVRNYILMGLDEEDQTRLYQRYWEKIERLYTGSAAQLDNFLRDFIALHQRAQKQGRVDQVYASFRASFEKHKGNATALKNLLKRMERYAQYHAAFVMGTRKFPEVAERLGSIRGLATTPAILIMRLLNAYEKDHMTKDDIVAALDLIESYLVRRDVCGWQTRSYWKRFSRLAYALTKTDVLGSLQVNLYWLKDTNYAFPTDREFRSALMEEELYSRKICRTLLERLENGSSRERTDTSGCTIEHIMPQNENLRAEWRTMLGRNWKEIQENWLHRLGNLTLTAYNETYSDKPFDVKKSVENGFNDSSLRLNKYVAKQDTWSPKEMRERGRILTQRALKIWPQLKVSKESLLHAKVKRLLEQTGDINAARSGMDDQARKVFDEFRRRITARVTKVIEVAKPKSVSYHNQNAGFICEVLPRTHRVMLMFDIDVTECAACKLEVQDTGDWRFIPHSQNDSNCFVDIHSVKEVAACMPLLKQAIAKSKD